MRFAFPFILTLVAGMALAQPAPLRLERSIVLQNVQGRIDHLAVDEAGRRLFVAALGNNTVEVIDLAAGQRVKSLPDLKEAQGVAYVPACNRLYVASGGDGAVHIFDAAGWRQWKSIDVGGDADNVRYDASARRVWVGHDGGLTALDEEGGIVAKLKLPSHPESFQLAHGSTSLFVNLPKSRRVTRIDRAIPAITNEWPAHEALANFALALDEEAKRIFTVYRLPARLVAMEASSGKVVAKLPTVGDCDDIFHDAARKRLYVIGGDGAIAVVRQNGPDQYEEAARIPTSKGARTGLFVPGMNRLFLAARAEGGRPAEIRVYEVLP